MNKCKITVLKRHFDEELAKEYGAEGLGKCPMHREGQLFYADYAKPDGLCDEAWKAIYQYAFALAHGSESFYSGDWIDKPGVAICSCNDGLRPVIFKVERTDEDAVQDNPTNRTLAALKNSQRVLTAFADASFTKEDAMTVLGMSDKDTLELLQLMVKQGLLVLRKEGNKRIYCEPYVMERLVQFSDRLDRKMVAFVGMFEESALKLKDLVYFAGGAPTETIPVYTDYLVVGRRGEDSDAYKKAQPMIDRGSMIVLTEGELIDICSGKIPAPPRQLKRNDRIIVHTTEEIERESEQRAYEVFEAKRDAFVQRWGELQADGSRKKGYM